MESDEESLAAHTGVASRNVLGPELEESCKPSSPLHTWAPSPRRSGRCLCAANDFADIFLVPTY